MESLCVSKMKSWLIIIIIVMVSGIEGGCIEEERKALLQIKTSLIDSYVFDVAPPLLSWVDDGGECCDWERVNCNTTTAHVTHLSLRNMVGFPEMVYRDCKRNWALNVSVFLHFKGLTSLNLSFNCLDDGIVNTGLGRLSSLKKLEILDLSSNFITNKTFPSLGALTSLRVLNLHYNELKGYFPGLALENLEILDLSWNINMEGFHQVSLPMLKSLDLSDNWLDGSFPVEELAHLTNLEELDLSYNGFNDTPSIQECTELSRLKKLKSITLGNNNFNKSIISCLSALPSLKTLDLSSNMRTLGGSFPVQELAHLTNLEELDLSYNEFSDTPSIQECTGLSRLKKLKSITLLGNYFNKSIISCLCALPSLKTLDLSSNLLEGSFPIQGMF